MNNIEIIKQRTQSKNPEYIKIFIKNIEQLHQISILRPLLNLIASKAKHNNAEFLIEPLKKWDRFAGHCETKSVFSKFGSIFRTNNKIVIKTNDVNVIMHEIAHACEKESGIDLNGEFRRVIGLDMQGSTTPNTQIAHAVNSVMKEQLKGYILNNVMEELFARFFEMIAMSYEVGGWSEYQFFYKDISAFFANTVKYVENIFNPLIIKKTDKDIINNCNKFVTDLKPFKKSFADNIQKESADRQIRTDGSGKWSNRTSSINDWSKSWEQYSGENLLSNNMRENKKLE